MIFSCPNKNWYFSDGQKKLFRFKILNDAYNNRPLEVWGDPQMKRDYVHIDNLYYIINSLFILTLLRVVFIILELVNQ